MSSFSNFQMFQGQLAVELCQSSTHANVLSTLGMNKANLVSPCPGQSTLP